ncbi:hypothetical protein K438DRAFT_1975487 [Mycena galopus ATCC 62051]|nr:hypothetical protein K438DRAFT_1975487 [Mycena galopus ATCC 62051]
MAALVVLPLDQSTILMGGENTTLATREAQRKQALLELKTIEDAGSSLSTTHAFPSFRSGGSSLSRAPKTEYETSQALQSHRRAQHPRLRRPAPDSARARLQALFNTICGYDPTLPSDERFCATLTQYDSVPQYSAKYQSEHEHSSAPTTDEPMVPSCPRHPDRFAPRPCYPHTPLPFIQRGLVATQQLIAEGKALRMAPTTKTKTHTERDNEGLLNHSPRTEPPSLLVVTSHRRLAPFDLRDCDAPPATYEDTEVEVSTPVPYRFEQEAADANLSGRRRLRVSKPDDEQSRGKPKW